MKLSANNLPSHLERDLQRAYLVSGDDPLLVQEACDALRQAARSQGFTERTVFDVGRSFDWGQLTAAGASLSLFAERRLLDVRAASNKLPKRAEEVLAALLDAADADTLLLLVVPRLDRKVARAAWVKAFEEAGAHVELRAPSLAQLPAWIDARLRSRGFQPSPEATQLLADRVEGNLLAAAQEVDKLALLREPGPLDEPAVRDAVADSARFDVFTLTDAALAAHRARALRILGGLRAEGVEATLVLWALTRELRTLAAVAWALATGQSMRDATRGVWQSRQQLMLDAARRIRLPGVHRLLREAGRVDRAVKGLTPNVAPWPALTDLVAGVAGVRP